MAKVDLFKQLKDYPDKKELINGKLTDLVRGLLQQDKMLTDTQRGKLAKLLAYIEINFKDF